MTLPSAEDRAAGRAPAGFLAFMALMSSVVALSIDAVLPALDSMAADLGMPGENDRQFVVTALFLGFGASQLVFGTLSDVIGRKPAAMIGWAIFVAGSLLSMAASTPFEMYAGRVLQGFGAGGPRVIALALTRDLYEGRAMARISSLIMMIFILVPMIAPVLGQAMEWLGGWEAIFGLFLALALVSGTWYLAGVPETLPRERRSRFGLKPLVRAFGAVLGTRASVCYALAMGLVFGAFVAWLGTSQQLLEEAYGLGPWFSAAFAGFALSLGVASWVNSRLVMRLGMRRLVELALGCVIAFAALGLAAAWVWGGLPPFWLFAVLMSGLLFPTGILFANFSALALEPLGAVAGVGASVVQFTATLISVPIGAAIGELYAGDPVPLVAGYGGLALASLGMTRLAVPRAARG